MLSRTAGKRLNRYIPDYVVFDLETTGLSAAVDAVIEIAAVKVRGGKIVSEFSTLVDPMRPIPWAAGCVNGIDDDMVRGSPTFLTVLEDFLDFAGDDVLVGHNIRAFDLRILCRDAQRYWGLTVGNDQIDTLLLSRQLLPELRSHSLVSLADYYGISPAGAHRARNDCRMNKLVFERLGEELAAAVAAGRRLCPACGKFLQYRQLRTKAYWRCTGYPGCKYRSDE